VGKIAKKVEFLVFSRHKIEYRR